MVKAGTNRQTDRSIDQQTDRPTADRQTNRLTDRQTHQQTDRLTDQLTDREKDWQTDQLGLSVLSCLRALTDHSNTREAPFTKFFPKLCLKYISLTICYRSRWSWLEDHSCRCLQVSTIQELALCHPRWGMILSWFSILYIIMIFPSVLNRVVCLTNLSDSKKNTWSMEVQVTFSPV